MPVLEFDPEDFEAYLAARDLPADRAIVVPNERAWEFSAVVPEAVDVGSLPAEPVASRAHTFVVVVFVLGSLLRAFAGGRPGGAHNQRIPEADAASGMHNASQMLRKCVANSVDIALPAS